jgi:hypothetical protein
MGKFCKGKLIGLRLAGFGKTFITCYLILSMGKVRKGNSDRLASCRFQENLYNMLLDTQWEKYAKVIMIGSWLLDTAMEKLCKGNYNMILDTPMGRVCKGFSNGIFGKFLSIGLQKVLSMDFREVLLMAN